MAHFAKIENGIVTQVIVVNNEIIINEEGVEQESLGIEFCQSLFGEETQWVQTSYNATFRGFFAGLGMSWDGKNFFIEERINETELELAAETL
jgi:hypothetical protein